MDDGDQVKRPKRKRRLLRGVCSVAVLTVSLTGIVWWMTIDKVDFIKMARVVRGVEKVVAELAGVE